MRRPTFIVAVLAFALVAGATPCFATNQNYAITLPRFGTAYYTSAKTVSGYRDLGVKHRYSGGKTVNFQVCDSQRNVIGSRVAVPPGGTAAPLIDLWYNDASSSRTVCVKMWTSLTTIVQVLAEGTWYWNY
jgi:hypothetical protein